MSATFVSLPVPSGTGVGDAVDVSTFGADKTIVVAGPEGGSGELIVEGSCDGDKFAPLTKFFTVDNPPERSLKAVVSHLRVRRLGGSGAAIVAVGAELANNQFSGVAEGALDTQSWGPEKTILVTGEFQGQVVIETSNDGAGFGAVAQFDAGGPGAVHIVGDYLRIRVRSPIPSGAQVQVGGGPSMGSSGSDIIPVTPGGDLAPGDVVKLIDAPVAVLAGGGAPFSLNPLRGLLGVMKTSTAMVLSGPVSVRLVDGLPLDSLHIGLPIYVSNDVAGRGTPKPPYYVMVLGTIIDHSNYESDGTVVINASVGGPGSILEPILNVDMVFFNLPDQSFPTDGEYTIGGLTFTVSNTANGTIELINGVGIRITCNTNNSNWDGNTRTAPMISIRLADMPIPLKYGQYKDFRAWVDYFADSKAADFESVKLGLETRQTMFDPSTYWVQMSAFGFKAASPSNQRMFTLQGQDGVSVSGEVDAPDNNPLLGLRSLSPNNYENWSGPGGLEDGLNTTKLVGVASMAAQGGGVAPSRINDGQPLAVTIAASPQNTNGTFVVELRQFLTQYIPTG